MDGVVAGQQGCPRGSAHGLHVGILQNDSTPRQPFHDGSEDFAVVPRDIVEACQSDVKIGGSSSTAGCHLPKSSANMIMMLGGFEKVIERREDMIVV